MATIRKSTKARKSAKKSTTRKTVRRSATKKRTAGKRKASPALARWRKAVRAAGYMKAGASFKPLPRKGTSGYKKIKAIYLRMSKSA